MQLRYETNTMNFSKIPGMPFAYWASKRAVDNFSGSKLEEIVDAVKGLDTCDNDKFVRFWYEVNLFKIGFYAEKTKTSNSKWFPYCKGGEFRRWFGNNEKIVDWENDGAVLKNLRDDKGKIKSRPQNTRYYFLEGLTWSTITGYKLSLRYMNNSIFGGGGSAMFSKVSNLYLISLMNSKVAEYYLDMLNPTLNILVGDMLKIPYLSQMVDSIEKRSKNNIYTSKKDWDSFETSWDFKKHPLI